MSKVFMPVSSYTVVVKHPPMLTQYGETTVTRLFLDDESSVHMVIDLCMVNKYGVMVRPGMQRGKGVDKEEQRRASIIFSAAKWHAESLKRK